jgi:hypothetical protein
LKLYYKMGIINEWNEYLQRKLLNMNTHILDVKFSNEYYNTNWEALEDAKDFIYKLYKALDRFDKTKAEEIAREYL